MSDSGSDDSGSNPDGITSDHGLKPDSYRDVIRTWAAKKITPVLNLVMKPATMMRHKRAINVLVFMLEPPFHFRHFLIYIDP